MGSVAYVHKQDLEVFKEALKRADYYINRLEASQRGRVVRDMDEACNAWESYRDRVRNFMEK